MTNLNLQIDRFSEFVCISVQMFSLGLPQRNRAFVSETQLSTQLSHDFMTTIEVTLRVNSQPSEM